MTFTSRINNNSLTPLFTLGNLYVSNFIGPDEKSEDYPKGELELFLDETSGLVQLGETVNFDDMYRKYWYASGVNESMNNELSDIVNSIMKNYKLKGGYKWLDIASNDGTLLSKVPKDIIKVGCDPSDVARNNADKCDIFINDYFSLNVIKQCGKFNIITAIAMFYDLNDPLKFLRDIYSSLQDDGLFVIQISYLPLMLQQKAFDFICHEHVCAYSLEVIKNLYEEAGFRIVDVTLNDSNGGSFRIYAQKEKDLRNTFGTAPYRDVANFRIKSMLEYEKTLELKNPETYKKFFNQTLRLKMKTRKFIKKAVKEGKTVMGLGACHDEKTRLVTKDGFKEFENINKNDVIYTINNNGEIEEGNIDEIFINDYCGEMINFYGKRINQLVTPNHNILYEKQNKKLNLKTAEEIYNIRWKLPKVKFQGKKQETFTLSDYVDQGNFSNKCRKVPDIYNMNDFMYLCGIFAGDGYCYNQSQGFSINLCVPKEDKARKSLLECLERMKLKYREYDKEIQIASKALYLFFQKFGNGALNKEIPNFLLEYNTNHLEYLLKGLVDSDGWYEKNGRKKFCSSSKKLIKDVIILSFKLGYYPSVTSRKERGIYINNRKVNSKQGYIINLSKAQPECYHSQKEEYCGKTWCLSTKNKNFLIERGGKLVFSGNSTKGNTLLQFFGLDNRFITAIADRQPKKVGLKTIGTEIPIISEEEMRERNPDYLLVLPWHFIYELQQRELKYLESGGQFIIPCPKFEVI